MGSNFLDMNFVCGDGDVLYNSFKEEWVQMIPLECGVAYVVACGIYVVEVVPKQIIIVVQRHGVIEASRMANNSAQKMFQYIGFFSTMRVSLYAQYTLEPA